MSPRLVLYLFVSFFVLIMCYEEQQHIAEATFHHTVSEEEAIRLRILANSDSIKDQALKREIRNAVNEQITEWVSTIENIDEAKEVIQNHLPEIEQIVAELLDETNTNQSFQVEFNKVEFPTKLYGDLVYPAGVYDAILITLGEGKGENWWCVLFPPLCFIDYENSEAMKETDETDEQKEVEVEFFISKLLDKFKSWFTNDSV